MEHRDPDSGAGAPDGHPAPPPVSDAPIADDVRLAASAAIAEADGFDPPTGQPADHPGPPTAARQTPGYDVPAYTGAGYQQPGPQPTVMAGPGYGPPSGPGNGYGPPGNGGYGDGYGHGPAAHTSDDAPHAAAPRRWLVVGGVAVAALALATTATAVAMHGSGKPAAPVAEQPLTSAPASPTPTGADTTDPATTDPTTAATTQSTTAATTPKQPKTSPRTTPKPNPPTGSNETDCENTSHETAQDVAMKFSGMNKGAQNAFLDAKAGAQQANIGSFVLNSGYRSAAYQQRIFDCWVQELGSPQAARQYALPANESAHVAGYAMDIAPQSAAAWLQSTAGQYGLCRRYQNEPWHFEYQAKYKTNGCPALLPQP